MRLFLWVLLALPVAGCASTPRRIFYDLNDVGGVDKKTLRLILWENALKPGENISNTTVMTHELTSYHVIQVRGAEEPHLHMAHDAMVFLESGSGTLYLRDKPVSMRPGAVVFIEHGTPHHFVNTGSEPAVAIAVFSPPYDGKDFVPVGKKK